MRDERCLRFLQWALPRMHLRWSGFRKVRAQVCKRVDRRIRALGLGDVDAYRAYLEAHAGEWAQLDELCHITISRFYRDQGVFVALEQEVLPSLLARLRARGDRVLRIWSAGCSSGEEPYTLAALWNIALRERFPDVVIEIVATDADTRVLSRAREGRYEFGSLKSLPESWRVRLFSRSDGAYLLKPEYRRGIEFLEQDIRDELPAGRFDLVLCRNLAFTYFDEAVQREVLGRILGSMHDGAALVIGVHERLPEGVPGLAVWLDKQRVFRKTG